MEHLLLSCIESRVENNRSLYGRFQLGPFDKSQGLTVANAMRRTLLSELSGLAILCVEIQGVSHEYSNLKGVRESVLDILLNLKQVVFISDEKFNKPEIGFLKMQGPVVIKSCDLKLPTFIQCVDPDQYIATLSDNGVLEMKFMICKGKNFLVQTSFELIQKYFQSHFHTKKESEANFSWKNNSDAQFSNTNFEKKQFQENFKATLPQNNKHGKRTKMLFPKNKTNFEKFEKSLIVGKKKTTELQQVCNLLAKQDLKKKTATNLLFIDAVFMPIKKVNFSIQNINDYSKAKKSSLLNKFQKNYSKEKIILEIWTNGSVHPRHAIYQAACKIIDILIPFQKQYSYKKTRFTLKPIILSKASFYSSNESEKSQFINNLNSSDTQSALINFKAEFDSANKMNKNFFPFLNKVYRPWLTSMKSINSKNNFFLNKKKYIGSTDLMYDNKKIKLKQSIENKLKFVDIVYLNLSLKSYICLKRANINTIESLLSHSRDELLLIKNLGEKSVKQIESILTKMNFKLRTEI